MVQLSAMVLAIGVPVANTMPPPRSSSHCVFRNRSVARWHSAGLGSPFTRSSLVANGRFFPPVRLIHEGAVDPQVFEGHGLGQALAVLQPSLAAQEQSGEPLNGFLN